MRLFSLLVLILFLFPLPVFAVELNINSNVDKHLNAQRLDKSLRSVEWFTLEYLRKAEQAEMASDKKQADFFLEKADDADEKASKIRWRSIRAWYEVGNDQKAHEVSLRAAHIAKVRAEFIELRLDKSELDLERLLSHGKRNEKNASVLDIYPSYQEANKHYIFNSYELFVEWTEVASMYDEAEVYEEAELYWQKSIEVMSFLYTLDASNFRNQDIPYQTYFYDMQRVLLRLESLQLSLDKTANLEITRNNLKKLEDLDRSLFPEGDIKP